MNPDTDTLPPFNAAAFEADWDAFMADLFDDEPESNGWEN